MAYIGREPLGGEVILINSIESQFNGVLTTFNLTRTVNGVTSAFYPISTEQLLVSLGGVIQRPDTTGDTGFRISFNTIIFAVAPIAGTKCFIVAYGNITDIGSPANNTVTTEKLANGSVTPAKLSTGGLWWLSSGNVGIGTTNPSTKLHVRQSADFDGITLTHASRAGIWKIYHSGTASENIAFVQNNGISDAVSYVAGRDMHNWYTGGTSTMVITNAGSVGVGTDIPLGKLSVSGSTDSRLLSIAEGSSTRFLINGSTASVDAGNAVFYTATAFDASHYMVLQNNTDSFGRVGLVIRGKTFNGANTPSTNDGWAMGGRSGIRFDAYLAGDAGFDTKFAIQHLLANGTNNSIGDLGILAKGYSTTAPAVMLTAAGNVGIGSANPNAKLHVAGGRIIVENTSDPAIELRDGSGSQAGFFFHDSTYDTLVIRHADVNGENHLVLNSTGNVGIGTTNPVSGLQVTKSGTLFFQDGVWMQPSGNTLITARGASGQDNWMGISGHYLATSGSSNILLQANFGDLGSHSGHYISSTATAVGSSYLSIGRILASSALGSSALKEPQLIISSAGNVGIGTTNPIAPTHIFRSTSGTALKLNNGAGGSGSYIDLDFDTYLTSQAGYANAVASIRVIDDGVFSGHITFRTKGASLGAGQSEKLRISSSGNVGIGTGNPTQKLHVYNGKISIYNEAASSLLDIGNNDAYKRVEGIVFIRNTSELTQTIATNNDAAANSQFCIKVELFVAGAVNDQDAIITFYAGANKMLPASTYTYWTGTPTVTNIRGTTGAGTVTWSSGNLQYTTASTNAYVRYIGNVTIWGHDRFNVSVIG